MLEEDWEEVALDCVVVDGADVRAVPEEVVVDVDVLVVVVVRVVVVRVVVVRVV